MSTNLGQELTSLLHKYGITGPVANPWNSSLVGVHLTITRRESCGAIATRTYRWPAETNPT